jgi:hypothetical protein
LRVSDVLHESSETNDKHRIPELETIVVFFDEAISLYLSLNFLLLVLLKQTLDGKAEKDLPFIRSCCVVTFRIITHALAIRILIQSGFDVQAKALLRSLDECCEFFSAILVKPISPKSFLIHKN